MKKSGISSLRSILGKPSTVGEKFHVKTKIDRFNNSMVNPKDWPDEWKIVFFKEYPRLDKIILPEDMEITEPFGEVLSKRQSRRSFLNKPISLESVASLLYYSVGLKSLSPPYQGNRHYPSAGARYPIETYLISLNSDLEQGLYHYNVRSNSLEVLEKMANFKWNYYFNQAWIEKAGAIIVLTAEFGRTMRKYGIRGYRHILVESGHIAQNFYLIAAALDLKICELGEYREKRLDNFLGIDGLNESVIGILVIGR